jgi:hypothetical protein
MSKHLLMASLLALLSACGSKTADAGSAGGAAGSAAPAQDTTAQIKAAFSNQLALLTKGDAAALRATFTERQREKITQEAVDGAKASMPKTTVDEMVSKVELTGDNAKVTMANGRTLTTYIRTDGKWLADTIWFK